MADLRRLRVGIDIDGRTKFYEGMQATCAGVKSASADKSTATVTLGGLSQASRNSYMEAMKNKKKMRVVVEAGRVSSGLFTLFMGDIIDIGIGAAPDFVMEIKAQACRHGADEMVIISGREEEQLRAIAEGVASRLGLALIFQAKDKKIANYFYTGDAEAQVHDLERVGGVDAYVDDGWLIVKEKGRATEGRRRILHASSGMVGLPRPKEGGVEVTYLIDGPSLLGGQISVKSKVNPALDGDYIISQLSFDARTHSDEFFYVAFAKPMGARYG